MTEQLTAEEARVAGALAEKQLSTPQYYPLTLNALVNACNQSNNRDPVVSYDEATVTEAIASLREKGYARLVHPGGGSRVTKYRQVLDEALGLDQRELALVCVLLLRGPQTLNELRTRTERLADFGGAEDVEHDIDRLASREEPLIARLGRQAGQREERFATTLTPVPAAAGGTGVTASAGMASSSGAPASGALRPRLPDAPRITPVTLDDATEEQAELLRPLGINAGNLFGTLARHPGLFRRWLPFGGKLLQGAKLSARLRELAILRTAFLVGAPYEWGQHVEIGRAAGLTDDDIERVVRGPGAGFEGLDALVLLACDEIHRDGMIGDDTWAGLAAELDEVRLIELPMLIGHYRMLSIVMASVGIQLEPGLPPLPPA